MGADEVACDDVSNPVDWTADGIVNLHEFCILSAAWLTQDPCAPWQPTDPNLIDNWDSRCDLDDDYIVNIDDFVLFCDEWLWQACWRLSAQDTWMYTSSGGGDFDMVTADQSSLALTTPAGLKRRKPPTYRERIDQLEELIYWVKELWLDPEIRREFEEKEWLEFTDKLWKEWERLVDKWSELNNDKSRL